MNYKLKTKNHDSNRKFTLAMGEMTYAIALADGEVQKEEPMKFHSIVEAELRCNDHALDISDSIFQIMNKDKTSTKDADDSAMNQTHTNSHFLSPQLKATFISIMEKVAKAYKPITINEIFLLEKFKIDSSIKSLCDLL